MSAESDLRVAKLEARVAIACAIAALLVNLIVYLLEAHDKHKEELMQHRRETLISALAVVDNVYANTSFDGQPPANPREWDISLARNAMNGIIIYCKDPNKTGTAFADAIGLYNHQTQARGSLSPKRLSEFRDAVCEELETSSMPYTDSERVWISSLPGSK
jgi:hypothetical protein